MKTLVALPLAGIILSVLQQSNALNSLALSTKQSPKSRISVASTKLETRPNGADTENDDISVDGVEFPPPLSSWDRTKRAATFYSTAVPIIANYYGLIGNLKVQELMGTEKFSEEEIEVCAS